MSTIKSSAEDLTLNADGSGNDIKFQSNGVEKGSLTAEGVMTATSFTGSGASLTALPAANITGTLPAINGASLTGVIPSKLPSYATDAAATTAGYNVAGGTYFNTTNKVVKTYNGTYYHNVGTEAGDWAPTTFDILGDGSCISLHDFDNTANDVGGLYDGSGSGIVYTTTYKKFGTHGLDVIEDGEYYDVAGLPKFYACSIWLYMKPGDTSSNYIFDWRHDNASNGRAYFYVNNHTINMADDTTYVNTIGDIYINGTQFTTGTYTFVDDTWYNIVVSVIDSGPNKGNWNQGVRIGNRSDSVDQGKLGYFDRFRAFNRSLNASDAQVLYQEGV